MSMTGVDPPDEVIRFAVPDTAETAEVEDIAIQADPLHAYMVLNVEFQYVAPTRSVSPSLSTVGAVDLAPRYRSSKES